MKRSTILIVDDMEINRVLLAEVFKNDYNIMEASGGEEAIKLINENENISAVLLDLVMPGTDGLGVLRNMNGTDRIKHTPVFIITASDSDEMLMNAYKLGAIDVISKPLKTSFIKARVSNTIELYRHRNKLEEIVAEQISHLNSMNRSMIETLATIIEFRDGESGSHVRRISGFTEIMLTYLSDNYPEYHMRRTEIDKICNASILHDVGKIATPDNILKKPGRLTNEEFTIMKEHTVRGCEILEKMVDIMDKDIYDYSYDICRHHHERWDGRGYPDGIKGEDIPIWTQVVAVADVYDALTSPRVYKAPFEHDVAVKMINNNECGTFNPKLLQAFNECAALLEQKHIEIGFQ